MKKSAYTTVIIPFIISAVFIFVAYYSVGVVERNIATSGAEEHISNIVSNIYENHNEYDSITEQLCSEYELKVQTLSVLISQLPGTLSEDMTAEELRIASGADKIMIADKTGLIIYSTSPDTELEYADEFFHEGLTQKNYCKTSIEKSENGCVFNVAVSRRNDTGLIIASFVNSALNEVLNYNGTSYAIHDASSFSSGITAITDKNTNRFIAHTNASLTGTECIIPSEKFKDTQGRFSYRFQNEPSIVFYQHYDDSTIILTIIAKKEIYTKRTLVLVWMILLDVLVFTSFLLSLRHYISKNDISS